jgi:hypothetical protein
MEKKVGPFVVEIQRVEDVLAPQREEWVEHGDPEGDGWGWKTSPNQKWTSRNVTLFKAEVDKLDIDAVVASVFPGVKS